MDHDPEEPTQPTLAPYLARALVGWAYRWGFYFIVFALIYWWTQNTMWLWVAAFASVLHLAVLLVWRVSQFRRGIRVSRRER